MRTCDFCPDNLKESFGDRVLVQRDGVAVAIPRKPSHDFHLLVFFTKECVPRVHLLSDTQILLTRDMMSSLDRLFSESLEGYLGYNMSSNNGEYKIRQHYQHHHIHMFMRFKGESGSPFGPKDEQKKSHNNRLVKKTLEAVSSI